MHVSLHILFGMKFQIVVSSFLCSRCHGPRPPANPEFTLKPKKKKSNNPSEPTPGSPCPPCPELVWRSCVGEHMGAERMVSVILDSWKQYMSCPIFIINVFPHFRWFAQIEHNFPAKICVEIFFLVVITFARNLAML